MTSKDQAGRPTRAAFLTPPGTAAIAVVAVHGPRAWEVVRSHFRARTPLPEQPAAGSVWFGHFGAETRDAVVVALKAFMPCPWVEIHCHGGAEVRRLIEECLNGAGVLSVSWETLLQEHGDNPLRAQARISLARALTVRTANILLNQSQGAFERGLAAILDAWQSGAREPALRLLAALATRSTLGRHLTTPWSVVLGWDPLESTCRHASLSIL